MLNFAEQTGSGAVMLVWSFPSADGTCKYLYNSLKMSSTSRDDVGPMYSLFLNQKYLSHVSFIQHSREKFYKQLLQKKDKLFSEIPIA